MEKRSVILQRVRSAISLYLSELLKEPITELRNWLRGQNGNVQPRADLQWTCDQARLETAGKIAGRGFHTLMCLWPTALKDLNDKRPGLLAGGQPIGEVIDELLGLDYGAPAERIHHAASGELRELDPQDLGKRIVSELAADGGARQAAKRALLRANLAEGERPKATLADLPNKPLAWQRSVPILLANPDLSNVNIQILAGVTLSKETIRTIRRTYGIPVSPWKSVAPHKTR